MSKAGLDLWWRPSGEIARAGGDGSGGEVVARWIDASVLGDRCDGVPERADRGGERDDGVVRVVWSGSYAEVDPDEQGGDDQDAEVPVRFRRDPRTWMSGHGWRALEVRLKGVGGDGVGLVLRTHARHVLSDTPSAFRLMKDPAFGRVGVLIDAAAMLTPEMGSNAAAATDHLTRIVEDVCSAACPRPPFAVALGQVGPRADGGGCLTLGFGADGPVRRSVLEELHRRLLHAGVVVVRMER